MATPNEAKDDDLRIVKFFDELYRQMRNMPGAERTRVHDEVHLHLIELIAAQVRSGSTETEAVDFALRQIGLPSQLGKQIRREWMLASGHAAGVSVRTLGEAYLWLILLLVVFGWFTLEFFSPTHNNITNNNIGLLLPAPLYAGFALGLTRPRQAVASMIQAAVGLYLLLIVVYFGDAVWLHFHPSPVHLITGQWHDIVIGGLILFVPMGVVGSISAYLTSARKMGGFYALHLEDFRLCARTAAQ